MASNYTTYPSGFKAPVIGDAETSSDVNATVVALHKLLESKNPIVHNWSFISEVLDTAKLLIPNFNEFLAINKANPRISASAYDLLVETVNFINTGTRMISLYTHLNLLSNETYLGHKPSGHIESRKLPVVAAPARCALLEWSRRPGGVEDILCTLNYIFGTNPHE